VPYAIRPGVAKGDRVRRRKSRGVYSGNSLQAKCRIGNGKFLIRDGDWRGTQRWRCYWRSVTKNVGISVAGREAQEE
jgi:hypothetical protein